MFFFILRHGHVLSFWWSQTGFGLKYAEFVIQFLYGDLKCAFMAKFKFPSGIFDTECFWIFKKKKKKKKYLFCKCLSWNFVQSFFPFSWVVNKPTGRILLFRGVCWTPSGECCICILKELSLRNKNKNPLLFMPILTL